MEPDLSKVDPKHLKVSYRLPGEGLSRRDLIFGLLKPQYEIIPAVEEGRCAAWRGCALCVASCPQEAISLKGQSAFIDKDQCTGCGACLPFCPEGAISSPLLDPEVLDASLQSLLCRDERGLEAKVVVITSDDAHALYTSEIGRLPPEILELRLPCIGALSPWLLLRCFDLGADGVAVTPCGPSCRHRCQPERWQETIRFVQALLVKLGIESGRVRAFSSPFGEIPSLGDLLRDFLDEVKERGPSRSRNGQGGEKKLTLASLLRDFAQRFHLGGSCLAGDEIPFGMVTIETGDKTCTLCGACPDRCPTEALTLREGAGFSQLLFDHSRCVACKECVAVCPEGALRVEKMLVFSQLGDAGILAEDRMARCRKCGSEIAPLRMMRKIHDRLPGRRDRTAMALGQLCSDCRIFANFDLTRG